ncbi:radical SAM protein [Paenibacillus algorifonticola]|uniref:Radical SAM protein n=1 Tax=Paenibacillus sp. BIHB 4019 TaxID=1870819 RepID=A0A1B2DNF0_9BACL|nr:radical SAM protein [Paenibacillus sp. BIHB 4019]ANY69245.1 radical SAM protein [Paenibacillus sp. BIHB 4019]
MKRFKKFYVEITSICNLACTFCPQTQRAKGFIQVEDFEKRLEQIKPFTDYIYFHLKGEPLLHPKIDELLDLSQKHGFKVNLTSNGTLLHKVKEKILTKPALRQMNFSLHSFDGHIGSTNKEGYVRSVLDFAREAVERTNMIISLRLWNLHTDNATNAERQRNRDVLAMIEQQFGLDYFIEERVAPGKGLKIADRIYLNQDHEFEWPDLKAEEDDGKGFCYGLRNQAGILVDGTVVPCCLDGEGVIDLGNINDKPFSDIIEDDRAIKLVEGFSRREAVEELCRKCGYRKRFGAGA